MGNRSGKCRVAKFLGAAALHSDIRTFGNKFVLVRGCQGPRHRRDAWWLFVVCPKEPVQSDAIVAAADNQTVASARLAIPRATFKV